MHLGQHLHNLGHLGRQAPQVQRVQVVLQDHQALLQLYLGRQVPLVPPVLLEQQVQHQQILDHLDRQDLLGLEQPAHRVQPVLRDLRVHPGL